ncbi:MAG: formylglycine-generating enzyme family protein [Balneolales bacterium]
MRIRININQVRSFLAVALGFIVVCTTVQAQPARIMIPQGSFHSVLPEVVGEPVGVDSFYIDQFPVTNDQFAEFLKENPRWRRSQIPTIYANNGYLKHWESDLIPGQNVEPNRPVTHISWFAANAYSEWNGGRLPTVKEWEFAAQAMDFNSKAEEDQFSYDLIGWYSSVNAIKPQEVGSTGIENKYGVKDMFGLIMEWAEDFKPPIGTDISLDCGTIGRMQENNSIYSYAQSLRYVTRMSFSASSTTGLLGFRVAYDLPVSNHLKSGSL